MARALLLPLLIMICILARETIGCPKKPKPNPNDCWGPCGNKGGRCENFCGPEGFCCRKGHYDCPVLLVHHLRDKKEASPNHHTCVKNSFDCKVGNWGPWACEHSAKCNGGTMTRRRKVVQSPWGNDATACPSLWEKRPCDTGRCTGNWSPWG